MSKDNSNSNNKPAANNSIFSNITSLFSNFIGNSSSPNSNHNNSNSAAPINNHIQNSNLVNSNQQPNKQFITNDQIIAITTDYKAKSILTFALDNQESLLKEFLKTNSINIDYKVSPNVLSPAGILAKFGKPLSDSAMQLLISKGADLKSIAIGYALDNNSDQISALLNIKNVNQQNILDGATIGYAMKKNTKEINNILIRPQVDIQRIISHQILGLAIVDNYKKIQSLLTNSSYNKQQIIDEAAYAYAYSGNYDMAVKLVTNGINGYKADYKTTHKGFEKYGNPQMLADFEKEFASQLVNNSNSIANASNNNAAQDNNNHATSNNSNNAQSNNHNFNSNSNAVNSNQQISTQPLTNEQIIASTDNLIVGQILFLALNNTAPELKEYLKLHSINLIDKDKLSAIGILAKNGKTTNDPSVKLLLANGATYQAMANGYARVNNYMEIANLLRIPNIDKRVLISWATRGYAHVGNQLMVKKYVTEGIYGIKPDIMLVEFGYIDGGHTELLADFKKKFKSQPANNSRANSSNNNSNIAPSSNSNAANPNLINSSHKPSTQPLTNEQIIASTEDGNVKHILTLALTNKAADLREYLISHDVCRTDKNNLSALAILAKSGKTINDSTVHLLVNNRANIHEMAYGYGRADNHAEITNLLSFSPNINRREIRDWAVRGNAYAGKKSMVEKYVTAEFEILNSKLTSIAENYIKGGHPEMVAAFKNRFAVPLVKNTNSVANSSNNNSNIAQNNNSNSNQNIAQPVSQAMISSQNQQVDALQNLLTTAQEESKQFFKQLEKEKAKNAKLSKNLANAKSENSELIQTNKNLSAIINNQHSNSTSWQDKVSNNNSSQINDNEPEIIKTGFDPLQGLFNIALKEEEITVKQEPMDSVEFDNNNSNHNSSSSTNHNSNKRPASELENNSNQQRLNDQRKHSSKRTK